MSERARDPDASAGPDSVEFAPTFDTHEVDASSSPQLGCPALDALPSTPRMPVLFLGHGNPMNALADNTFTRSLGTLASELPRPAAVLCVSAHWMTSGDTRVLTAEKPRTIYDFYGFPPELYEVRYPASGSPEVAKAAGALTGALPDADWGLDHGAWTVLVHMWPAADVPVLELSIDMAAPPEEHLEAGRRLAPLRDRGVLVIGSGNIVHNLRAIDWESPDSGYDWAVEFDAWARDRLLERNADALAAYRDAGRAAQLSVPTPDHYLPLLAAAGAAAGDSASFIYEGMELGSLSMRCVRWG